MKKLTSASIFNSRRFNTRRRHADFLNAPSTPIPRAPIRLVSSKLKETFRSLKNKKKTPNIPLNASLDHLISELQQFYAANRTIDELRHQYGSPWHMPQLEKTRFYESKQIVIEFNHALRNVINTGTTRFDFDGLLAFITTAYANVNGQKNAEDFYHHIRTTLVGMRNEMAVEQMLINAGISYELGSLKQDAAGGDFIINGVPIDVKASEKTAETTRQRAIDGGYDPSTVLWSHIDFEDFNGELSLPLERSNEIFAQLKPELDGAIASQKTHSES